MRKRLVCCISGGLLGFALSGKIGDALELRHLRREMRNFHRRFVPTATNKDGVRPETNQEYLERLRQAEIETR